MVVSVKCRQLQGALPLTPFPGPHWRHSPRPPLWPSTLIGSRFVRAPNLQISCAPLGIQYGPPEHANTINTTHEKVYFRLLPNSCVTASWAELSSAAERSSPRDYSRASSFACTRGSAVGYGYKQLKKYNKCFIYQPRKRKSVYRVMIRVTG